MHVRNFLKLSEELSRLIESEGWAVRPYQSSTLPFFKGLSEEQAYLAEKQLSDYLKICQNTRADGHPIKDARFLVRKALEYYGFSFHEDVFTLIETGHVVEFYNMTHFQMFRTFNYFEYSSYTIEDMYCRPWFTLYERDQQINEKLLALGTPILLSDVKGPTHLDVGAHLITERASLERLQIRNKSTWMAPLFKGDQKVGYVAIQKVEPLA